MPIEHHSPVSTHNDAKESRLINARFALQHIVARTALATIYRASDLQPTTQNSPEKSVLLLLVAPVLAQQHGFERAWQHTLIRPAPPSAAYPEIITYGEDNGEYWLALNDQGELLSEQINKIDERGLTIDSSLATLENISHALSGIQAGAFGYLEPGAIQQNGQSYIILNAPLVKIQQQLATPGQAAAQKLALHSGYISPSVAVGDAPVTEDDTFSAAAILYALLAGEAPYGERSTLTAVTQEFKPAHLKKLPKDGWEVLSSALAFRRKPRAENPDKLLTAMRKASKRKILVPAMAVAALGVVAFAVYHLTSKVGELINVPETAQQQAQVIAPEPQLMQEPVPPAAVQPSESTAEETMAEVETPAEAAEEMVTEDEDTVAAETIAPETTETAVTETETAAQQPESDDTGATSEDEITETAEIAEAAKIELVDEPEIPDPEVEQAAVTAKTNAEAAANQEAAQQAQIDSLLKQAQTAIDKGQINDTNNIPGALSFLRQLTELDEDNKSAQDLLNKVLDKTFDNAEALIANNDFRQAQTNLNDGDKIIREFMLTGHLQKLVRLESKLAIIQQEEKQVGELLQKAEDSIRAGNLTKDDSDTEHALLHLDSIMFKQPDNPQALALLKQVAQIRQQATRAAIAEGELEQAGTYLSESERLIRKYRFTDLQSVQQELDAAYTTEATGVAPVAEIKDPVTGEAAQLPVEKLQVNPISIQEMETVVIEEIVPIAEEIPELDATLTTPAATPIWETDTLESTLVQQPDTNNNQIISTQPQASAPQPIPRYEPKQIPQPQVVQPVQNNTQDIYTYQPTDQQLQPIDQQLFNDFGAAASPVGTQPAAIPVPAQAPAIRQQPQYQPQPVQIPEVVPMDTIPELEEIPLSDIEEILPAAN